jgi:hypothetical protein
MQHQTLRVALSASLFLAASWAHAGGYVEGADLSNNRLAPTPVLLDPGLNTVQGTVGYSGAALDRDFFKFTVPAGFQLSALVLGPATQVGGCCSFIGVQAGPTITVDPDTTFSGAALLGWHLYSSADKGNDILPLIGFPVDKIGFSGPLPAGTYSWWVQELAPNGPFPYQFDFQVTAVPEPSQVLLMATGALLLVGAVKRGRH